MAKEDRKILKQLLKKTISRIAGEIYFLRLKISSRCLWS